MLFWLGVILFRNEFGATDQRCVCYSGLLIERQIREPKSYIINFLNAVLNSCLRLSSGKISMPTNSSEKLVAVRSDQVFQPTADQAKQLLPDFCSVSLAQQ